MSLNADVLERTFQMVEPRADNFAKDFYKTLFTDCPEAKPLFASTDMASQQKKLTMSLVYIVANLRHPNHLVKSLKELGAKHLSYGAASVHYPIVGAALLKTLAAYLGQEWTPEVEKAWTDAYGVITNVMLEGAQEYESTLSHPT